MAALFRILLTSLKNLRVLLVALFGQTNLLGWTVAAAIPIAYIAIWLVVLNYTLNAVFNYLSQAVSNGQIFSSAVPAAGLWLLEQAMPIQLFFDLAVTYLVFRLTAAQLLVAAIAASRYLKGK